MNNYSGANEMLEPKWGHLLANEAAAIDVVDDDGGAAATVAAVAAST